MKNKYLKSLSFAIIAFIAFSCSSDETINTTETSGTSTTINSNASVKLTAINSSGATKANYIIMMFETPLTTNSPMPTIIKQVTTDANGLANFDLSTIVTSATPKKYYFEAFISNGSNYTLKSISHPDFDIAKGIVVTSSIIVSD